MCFATVVVPVCVVLCVSCCGCGSHWNGCMNVACCVLWGGSRSTKSYAFPCKSGCSRRWKVPRVCGGCGCGRLVPSMCFATMVVPVCVVLCVSWSRGCRSHWNGCVKVACCVLWGGSRSTKSYAFPCKSGCSRRWKVPRVCGGCGCGRLVPSMCFATMVVPVCVVLCVSWSRGCRSHWNGCVKVAWCRGCMRNTIVFCSWRLLIVLESLHPGCDSDLSAAFLNFGASNFPSKNLFTECFKIIFLLLWRRDPVLELQFPTPLRVVLLCFATQSLQIAL